LFLCLTTHHAMKTYGGVEVELHEFFTLQLGESEWSDSRLGRFNSGEIGPGLDTAVALWSSTARTLGS